MKKGLLLGIALLVIASAVSAQAPPQGYFGLFFDLRGWWRRGFFDLFSA